MQPEPVAPRILTADERRLVLALSRVAWRTFRRWERGEVIKGASLARINEAVARVRAPGALAAMQAA